MMSALPPRSGESPRRGVSRLEMMQARFQAKQLEEKEEKMIQMLEDKQERTIQRVNYGRDSANSTNSFSSSASSNSVTGGLGMRPGYGQHQGGGGRVRQMFDQRSRGGAGSPVASLHSKKSIEYFSNMKQFSLAVLSLTVHVLCITYVSASSANNHSSKLKRLRNKPKLVQQNRSVLEEVFDPYLGLVEDLDGRKELVVDAPMSMVLVEPMPSSRPTSLEPTLSPSSVPSHSPTSMDFGKVEGKARNSAVGAELAMSAFAVLLITGFLS